MSTSGANRIPVVNMTLRITDGKVNEDINSIQRRLNRVLPYTEGVHTLMSDGDVCTYPHPEQLEMYTFPCFLDCRTDGITASMIFRGRTLFRGRLCCTKTEDRKLHISLPSDKVIFEMPAYKPDGLYEAEGVKKGLTNKKTLINKIDFMRRFLNSKEIVPKTEVDLWNYHFNRIEDYESLLREGLKLLEFIYENNLVNIITRPTKILLD